MLYYNEIFEDIQVGDQLKAYVKHVRDDLKIDLSLQPLGYEKRIDPLTEEIMKALKENEGFIAVSDKSPSDDIEAWFSCSKKSFKKAVGALYKKREIEFRDNGIAIVK